MENETKTEQTETAETKKVEVKKTPMEQAVSDIGDILTNVWARHPNGLLNHGVMEAGQFGTLEKTFGVLVKEIADLTSANSAAQEGLKEAKDALASLKTKFDAQTKELDEAKEAIEKVKNATASPAPVVPQEAVKE